MKTYKQAVVACKDHTGKSTCRTIKVPLDLEGDFLQTNIENKMSVLGFVGPFLIFDGNDAVQSIIKSIATLDELSIPVKVPGFYEDDPDLLGFVKLNEAGVSVSFNGYTDCNSSDDTGSLVVIDVKDGDPHVSVFSDINSESPTHTESFMNARNENRTSD